jgi:nucleotide-binding universal stress UspA family protein
MPIRTILAPVDCSEHSRRALEYAVELAELVGAERVEALFVTPRAVDYSPLDRWIWGEKSDEHPLDEDLDRALDASFREFLDGCSAKVVDRVTPRRVEGVPHKCILEAIERDRPDLTVLGTRGRTGAEHLLLGSVAERIVRHADRPVLTVP